MCNVAIPQVAFHLRVVRGTRYISRQKVCFSLSLFTPAVINQVDLCHFHVMQSIVMMCVCVGECFTYVCEAGLLSFVVK